MNFRRTPEFEKELKALAKKWRSLPNDINVAEAVISALYEKQKGVDASNLRKNFFDGKRASILSTKDNIEAVKMRVDCASLSKKDCVRLIFVYVFDGEKIILIELFSKTDKAREDTKRLQKVLASY